MKKPLIVAAVWQQAATDALRQMECELLTVAADEREIVADCPRPPRLFVIQASSGQPELTVKQIQSLRRARPLTDAVVWAPRAAGAAVRSFFRAGARDVVVSPLPAKLVASVEEALRDQQILPRLNELSRRRGRGSRFESMLSRNESMWDLFDLCTRIAPADATVLIVGETGTGKELLARAVHRRSGRKGRFVAANCASIASELINSELFGHKKGAFTGADRNKKGLVSHAQQGTLFLDEIGDMPPETQQSLLRMLQEKRIRPVGSVEEMSVDVRVVAATNVALDQAVRDGDFREDLFYRLDVIRMNIPPLRERPEDILFLFGHFTKQLAKHYGLDPPTFSDSFIDALLEYDWPGNVRQLENLSERLVLARPRRALVARDFEKLRTSSLAEPGRTGGTQAASRRAPNIDPAKTLQDNVTPAVAQLECDYLRAVLESNEGRVTAAAAQAGISRRTLLRKMNLYGIDKREFKT